MFATDSSVWAFFFFSSRRRHTRYWRDWSSDVCSSDLGAVEAGYGVRAIGKRERETACYQQAEQQRIFVFNLRSEEHTSELQSRQYLVCRLLLEKKKQSGAYHDDDPGTLPYATRADIDP